jgi:hypothetical protein
MKRRTMDGSDGRTRRAAIDNGGPYRYFTIALDSTAPTQLFLLVEEEENVLDQKCSHISQSSATETIVL